MLIIHPKDRTTAMLAALYQGKEMQLIDTPPGSHAMKHLLYHTPPHERIMLLGHGSAQGLYYRKDDVRADFDGYIVNRHHAYSLRRHGPNLVGIWCHAVDFARKMNLKGLFSGMIISDMEEAAEYHIDTTPEELGRDNAQMVARLRFLLDTTPQLRDIPAKLAESASPLSPLSRFNWCNFYYL